MPFWKAGKNDDQVLDDIKETQKQNADEFVKEQAHTKDAKKSSLIIDNDFTPVTYDPQYILQVNHLKKYFPHPQGELLPLLRRQAPRSGGAGGAGNGRQGRQRKGG